MAFVKLTDLGGPSEDLFVTVQKKQSNGTQTGVLSSLLHQALGAPRALTFAWDADAGLMRLEAAAADSPGACVIRYGHSPSFAITRVLRTVGVSVHASERFPATLDGPTACIINLSAHRSN